MDYNETTSLSRLRAAFAYNEVSQWAPSWFDNALGLVKGLPAKLRTLGLPVVLAILISGNNAHEQALTHLLSRWLLEEAPHRPLAGHPAQQDLHPAKLLLAACIQADRSTYLAAQSEALALIEYVKLFAEAMRSLSDADLRKEDIHVSNNDDSQPI